MKRYIVASISDDYRDLLKYVPPHTPCEVTGEGDLLYNIDPEFFDTFCVELAAYNIEQVSDRRRKVYVDVTYPTKTSTRTFSSSLNRPVNLERLVNNIKYNILSYYEKQRRTAELKSAGKKEVSALTFTKDVLKDRLDITPAFSYPGQLEYMLYELPFADLETKTVDVNAAAEFKQKLMAVIDELEADYGFDIELKAPTSGYIVRTSWKVYVDGDPVIYDKKTGTYTRS